VVSCEYCGEVASDVRKLDGFTYHLCEGCAEEWDVDFGMAIRDDLDGVGCDEWLSE